jgi:hypothetical protein
MNYGAVIRNGFLRRARAVAMAWAVVFGCCDAGLASSSHGAAADHSADEEMDSGDVSPTTLRGIELGEFRIRAYYPVQAQKSMVRFVLHVAVPGDRYSATQRLIKMRRHKVRDQVITATRLVPLADFDNAELKSFRRRILLRLRRTLPELEVDDVYVSNFELKVQSL